MPKITHRDIVSLKNQGWFKISLPIERDFFLNVFLYYLYNSLLKDNLIFKGGTALKKVYFSKNLFEYRFSKDLDFTINKDITPKSLCNFIDEICSTIEKNEWYRFKRIWTMGEGEYWEKSYAITVKLRNPWETFSDHIRVKFDFRDDKDFNKKYTKASVKNYYKRFFDKEIYCYCESIDEIFKWKMEALFWALKRTEAKDFFDLVNIIDAFWDKINYKNIIKNYTIYMSKERIEVLKKWWGKTFETQLACIPDFDFYLNKFQKQFDIK